MLNLNKNKSKIHHKEYWIPENNTIFNKKYFLFLYSHQTKIWFNQINNYFKTVKIKICVSSFILKQYFFEASMTVCIPILNKCILKT